MGTALRPVEVEPTDGDALAKVPTVSADAFIDDPVYRWMLPGRLRMKTRLRTMFRAELEQYILPNGGTVWTTGGYDGAVATLPPGAWEMPASITAKQALTWLRAFGLRLMLAGRVAQTMQEHHLREPHFYIRLVGVRPGLQGQGLGTTLIAPTLERADAAGLPSYLEASSERSAALYERLGFVHLGALEFPDGGPPVWPMRRPSPTGG